MLNRFEAKFVKSGACWLWTGAKHPKGYGSFRFNRKPIYAHRASWLLYRGEIPDGLDVLHECDTPACVNPDHLFLGTHAENVADMVSKGRVVTKRGSAHKLAKLSEADIPVIRADDRELKEIAADYGVSFGLISHIKSGKRWRHV